jgi:hypothetical protein
MAVLAIGHGPLRARERSIVGTQSGAELGAAMGLRSRRRGVVVWSRSAGSVGRRGSTVFTRIGRHRPVRRCLRLGALLTVMGLVSVARGARLRWRPLLAGVVLTAAGVILRSGPGSLVFLPGILLLLYAPFIEARPDAGQKRRIELRRELGGDVTRAQRRELEAALDRYPDAITHELREILARQALAPASSGIPGARRY